MKSKRFYVGDWVYAGNWCYGQIVEVNDTYAAVEFDTGNGGGTLHFDFEDLEKAHSPRGVDRVTKPEYAVVVTYSFDSQVSVILFNNQKNALNFVKRDVEREMHIDTYENGWDTELSVNEDGSHVILTAHFDDHDDITEWRLGELFDERTWR